MSGAQIDRDTLAAPYQVLDPATMGLRKIGNVDKIPDAAAVSCRVI